MRDPLEATAYLQVRKHPAAWRWEARVIKSTQRRPEPEHVEPGCIVVKVRLRIPFAAWGPFEPEAVINVPADLIQRPIEVEAVDPS